MNNENEKYRLIKNLFLEGIKAVSPIKLIDSRLRVDGNNLIIHCTNNDSEVIKINQYKNIFVIGAGKASATMALKIENILGKRISSGVIVTKYGFVENLKWINLIEAGHPIPDTNGIRGAQEIIEVCKNAGENDLIISLISGGASALLPFPVDGVSLEDKSKTTNELLKSGATINELNTIRKHISKIKGGKLLEHSYPSKIISLILSDVIGDRLDVIGSGITVEDTTTFKDCVDIVEKYNLKNSFPKSVINHLQKGLVTEKKEFRKIKYENVTNIIIGNNSVVLNKIKEVAEAEGYKTEILNWQLEGEAEKAGADIVEATFDFIDNNSEPNQKYCFLYGGETSVTIKGNGKGGRNQELILSAAIKLNNTMGITMLSGGTDGNDGPTDAAGAICNEETIKVGEKLGLNATEYLKKNDSYNYFKKTDSLLITGPTGTNVVDVQIVLVET